MAGYPEPGDHVGPYRVVRRIGRGGMGVVFAATEANLDREVALKVLSTDLAHDPDFRSRFTQEAKALAALDSANVVHVYSHGEENGQLYIATQLVPDGDLHKLLAKGGAMEVDQALDFVAQVAAGVADAHDAGLIHRDIKPANVLLRRRGSELRAYVTDFGLARSASQHTMSGLMVGTPSYMAPELHEGRPATISSDIYALGCLLWATLSGKAPYQGTTEFEIIRKHMTDPIPSFEGNDRLARALNRTLNLSLAKHPDRRYRNARDLRADLLKAVPLARERSGRPDTKSHELPQTRLPGQHSPRPSQMPDHPAIPSNPSNPSMPSAVPPRPTPSSPPYAPAGSGEPATQRYVGPSEPAQSHSGPATPSYSTPQYSQQSYFQNTPPPAVPPRQKSMLPLLTGIVGVLVIVVAGVLIWALMQGGNGGGGGGSDDPTTSLSREERAASAVSEGLQENDDNMKEPLADCIGEKWVAKSGVDDIVEAGYLDEELTTYNKDPEGDDNKIISTSLDQLSVIGTCSKSQS